MAVRSARILAIFTLFLAVAVPEILADAAVSCPQICVDGGYVKRTDDYITITCKTDFVLIGAPKLVCGKDGAWSDDAPKCQRRALCADIPGIAYGTATRSVNHTQPGGTVAFECDKGYVLVGRVKVTCQKDGTWDHASPECIEKCRTFTHLLNGKVTEQNTTSGGKVKFQCNEGHKLVGSDVLTCRDDKLWDGKPPVCLENMCPSIPILPHGRIDDYKRLVGSKITVVCNVGYKADGATELTCNNETKWSPAVPTCERDLSVPDNKTDKSCPFFKLENGKCKAGGKAYRCSCNHGYDLRGSKILRCRKQGWNGYIPTCVSNMCPIIDFIENGFIKSLKKAPFSRGEKIKVVCNDGYSLDSSKKMICGDNNRWSHIPKCVVPACRHESYFENGNIVGYSNRIKGGTFRFTCNPGYSLEGAKKMKCQKKGWWPDRQFPKCIPTPDCDVPCLKDGLFRERMVKKKKVVTYACYSDFRLSGASTRKCRNGKWNKPAPTCVDKKQKQEKANDATSQDTQSSLPEACIANPVDVYLVVDDTGSHDASKAIVRSISEIVTQDDESRVGLITYAGDAETEASLSNNVIDAVPSEQGSDQRRPDGNTPSPQRMSPPHPGHPPVLPPNGHPPMPPMPPAHPFMPQNDPFMPPPFPHPDQMVPEPRDMPPQAPFDGPNGGSPNAPNGRDSAPAMPDNAQNERRSGNDRRLDLALTLMLQNFREEQKVGKRKVAVIISNGKSLVSLEDAKKELQKTDIKVLAITLRREADNTVDSIVNVKGGVVSANDANELDAVSRKIAEAICNVGP